MMGVGSGAFGASVPRTSVLGGMRIITSQLGRSCTSGAPIFLTILGNSFVFTTSLVQVVAMPDRVSFIGCTSCRNADSANDVGALVNLGRSLANHRIIVIRSVISSNFAVTRVVRSLGGGGPTDVRVYSLLIGPNGLGISLSVGCTMVRVPGSFVMKCKLSCSRRNEGLHSVCAVMRR